MQKPLVSIIIPCYNASKTIAQTIESVLAQTYDNWEMIIVDDCSTDTTAEVIARYQERDKRIKYIKTEQPSGSPATPRNTALDNARGEYLAMLDSDDSWIPEKLQEQLEFARKHNYDFVYSNYEKMNCEGKRNNRIIRLRAVSSYWSTLESNSIPCLTVLIKRELLGFRRFRHIPKEDYALWLEILKEGNKAYNTGKTHAVYREQTISRSGNKFAMVAEQWYILRKIEGVKLLPALYFMSTYMLQGVLKYIK